MKHRILYLVIFSVYSHSALAMSKQKDKGAGKEFNSIITTPLPEKTNIPKISNKEKIEDIMEDFKKGKKKIDTLILLLKLKVEPFSELRDADGGTILHIIAAKGKTKHIDQIAPFVSIEDIKLQNKFNQTAEAIVQEKMVDLLHKNKNNNYETYGRFLEALKKLEKRKAPKKQQVIMPQEPVEFPNLDYTHSD